jgi:hypothetical protein
MFAGEINIVVGVEGVGIKFDSWKVRFRERGRANNIEITPALKPNLTIFKSVLH